MKNRIVFFLLFISFTISLAQSPGGVNANLTLWLKADNAASLTGNPIQSWASSGGTASGYAISQSVLSKRPAIVYGNVNSTKFNYNPRVKFTSTGPTIFNVLSNSNTVPDLLGNNGLAIIVTTNELGNVFTYSSSTRYQLKPNFRFQTGSSGMGYTFDWTAPTEYSTTSAFIPESYGCAATMNLRKNSVLTPTASNSNMTLYNPSISPGLYMGANNLTEPSNASVAEVILYNVLPNLTEMNKIETYLSIKYGITRGGNTGVLPIYNYIASDGTTVMWDKTTNTGFNFDIAGIGRDDNSSLNQKQSISVNNGEALTIALGNIAIPTQNSTNTAVFANDNSFLVWGNNGQAKSFNAVASKPAGIQERLDRVWKLQASNFNQLVSLGFETSQITASGAIGTLCLLFDDDGNFSDASVIAPCLATNVSGSRIDFSAISLPTGKPYFTIGRLTVPTTISNNGPLCPGATLVLNAQQIAGASYSWTGPNAFNSTHAVDSVVNSTVAAAGLYQVSISNYGCISNLTTTAAITASQSASVSISQSVGTNPACQGASVSFLASPVNRGLTPSYQWQVNGVSAGTGVTFTSTSLVNNDAITVVLSSSELCVSTPVVTSIPLIIGISAPVIPSVTVISNKLSICDGSPVTFTATALNGGASPTYQWQVNGVNDGTNNAIFTSNHLSNTDAVTVVLTSSEACAVVSTANSLGITVSVTPQPIAAFTFDPFQPNETDPLVTFQNGSLNATNYTWNFGDNSGYSNLINPQYTFPSTGDYIVSLIAENGPCSDTAKQTISVEPFTSYFIPNSFTPNGDGRNETFGIEGSGIVPENFEMKIYNRWGNLVFTSSSLDKKWDGNSLSGVSVPDGTYVYTFRFKLKNSNQVIKKEGNLTLYR